ncbi:MAG: phycobiliprotein lyase [Oscillatoria sp. PMC 1051.18]|uniref:phycobiliprotein lyase n=1 Tax=Oscillatoria salina TaxID=331517 RepID=UPI001CCF03E2|nr:phycobiliprotein lyase [Oscillatoria salina]MBZ8181043.1 phycobiliprotein lyase [Oscillatoria salina IIICB1]MEC4892151.1 phycobiliprotein lyase [Oscillatoria sp. PMC 1050.18]MEC5029371.1 phycobiliprotein lyase [Oscillatoria sp. PMC 1051.18]
MDAMEFFQRSAGKWRSQRVTHHLAFRRAESGGSEIFVEPLAADNPKVIEICKLHDVDPSLAVGGAFVSWDGSMDWDKEGEEHKGTTVFSLVPDPDNPKKGRLLRERGYAEIVPVAGRYEIDDEEALVLVTDYETMSTTERFWFASPDLRLRTSTVTRFGGFSTATFCAESRIDDTATAKGDSNSTSKQLEPICGW